MLDKETRDNIRYLALIKQKEQLEKEIEEIKEQGKPVSKENLQKMVNYFKV